MIDLISEYYKNPVNNYIMKNPTVSRSEWNTVCGDDIIVFCRIEGDKIAEISFSGNTSMITTAAASYWTELATGMSIDRILTLWYDFMVGEWFEVSPKRIRAATIAILATRNAIHEYLKDGVVDERESVVW